MAFPLRFNDEGAAPRLRVVSPTPSRDADLTLRAYTVLTSAALALGLLVRALPVLVADFPLGDGGLFYQMARDLQHAGFHLPQTTSYNHANIPFVYPPLMIYAAAIVNRLTPLGLLTTLRILPLLGSIATMLAVALLAKDMLASRAAAVAATFAFAIVPRAFLWLVMGGGLTRSFGFAFAILTIHAAYLLYTRRQWRFAGSATIFASLALLSHIEMTWFAAFSVAILFVAYGRHRTGVLASVAVCCGIAALTAPWWLTIVARDGLQPFVAAANARDVSTSNPLLVFIEFRFTNETLFPLVAAVGLLGAVVCVAARRFVLPVWLVAAALLDSRGFGTVASVPLALLAAIALVDVILPFVSGAIGAGPRSLAVGATRGEVRQVMVPAAGAVIACCLVVYGLVTAMVSTATPLSAMSADERAAMQWASDNTPSSSRFLVVSGDVWALDRTSEWLPTLTGRTSAVTPQGYEWLPHHTFTKRLNDYTELQKCSNKLAACVESWSAKTGIEFDYLYLPKLSPRVGTSLSDGEFECCAALRASLRTDPRYITVFDGPGATIFERRS